MKSSTIFPMPIGYLLTKIGQATTARFAEQIAVMNLRPKHYGLLVTVAMMPLRSQQELGRALGIVPSAIVTMVDDLEALGAIVRIQDPTNRRQFAIEITDHGREFLTRATELGAAIDDEILKDLGDDERAALHRSLSTVASRLGLIPVP